MLVAHPEPDEEGARLRDEVVVLLRVPGVILEGEEEEGCTQEVVEGKNFVVLHRTRGGEGGVGGRERLEDGGGRERERERREERERDKRTTER